MDVDGVKVTAPLQQDLSDLHTARERCPVETDILLLNQKRSPGQRSGYIPELPLVGQIVAISVIPQVEKRV